MIDVKFVLTLVNALSGWHGSIARMPEASSILWMQPAATTSGCGGCLASASGPRCRSQVTGEACADPQLAGRRELVDQVLQELNRQVVDPEAGRGIVDLQWVQSLRIEGDEAELTLSFAPVCGPAKALADSAFQTLRRLLPDTDVYVLHTA